MELLSEDVEKMNQIYNYFIQLDQQGTLSERSAATYMPQKT